MVKTQLERKKDSQLVDLILRVKTAEDAAKKASADFEGLGAKLLVLGENLGALGELVVAQRALIHALIAQRDR